MSKQQMKKKKKRKKKGLRCCKIKIKYNESSKECEVVFAHLLPLRNSTGGQ